MGSEPMRPTYTKDQISQYFDRLKIPENKRQYSIADLNPEDALKYLALLQKHHMATIPFENLSLHYSHHRQISLHPEEIYKKFITDDNNRGGYCMEQNALLGTILYSLGFTLYPVAGRVMENGRWCGWAHMVNLVTIGETKYHVDVGFGPAGPVMPNPLDHTGSVRSHISPAEVRLQWRNVSGNHDPNQRLWAYEYRRDEDSDWEEKYCFTELEFQPSDFEIANYFTSTSSKTWFTRSIVTEKKILDERGECAGSVILFDNNIKWRIHGVKEKEIEFKTEEERMEALEKHFGIKFGETGREAIRRLPSEIQGDVNL